MWNSIDIKQRYSALDEIADADKAIKTYNCQLTDLTEQHAPLQTKTVIARPNGKWYKQHIRNNKTLRRRLERKKKKTGLNEDKLKYQKQCKYVNF